MKSGRRKRSSRGPTLTVFRHRAFMNGNKATVVPLSPTSYKSERPRTERPHARSLQIVLGPGPTTPHLIECWVPAGSQDAVKDLRRCTPVYLIGLCLRTLFMQSPIQLSSRIARLGVDFVRLFLASRNCCQAQHVHRPAVCRYCIQLDDQQRMRQFATAIVSRDLPCTTLWRIGSFVTERSSRIA